MRYAKIYKVIMVEDGSTITTGFVNPITAAACMRNHKDYGVLDRKDWKVVRDYEAELDQLIDWVRSIEPAEPDPQTPAPSELRKAYESDDFF